MKKIFVLAFFFVFVLSGCSAGKDKGLNPEEAKTSALNFINGNLLQTGKATIKEIVSEGDLYKLTVILPNGQETVSYISKDGKKFFPQVMDVKNGESDKKEVSADKSSAVSVSEKREKAEVELFVMSHCPFGTQMEKGILPVIETLGGKVDFTLKFCGYAMHGEKELEEELNQYCIQKEQPDKLLSYLKCFLEAGDGASCLAQNGVDGDKLSACTAATDSEFKVKENFSKKETWLNGKYPTFDIFKTDNERYGIQGSPALVINGEQVKTERDAGSLLKAICSGYDNPPEECETELSSISPSAGFGFGKGGESGGDASCQ